MKTSRSLSKHVFRLALSALAVTTLFSVVLAIAREGESQPGTVRARKMIAKTLLFQNLGFEKLGGYCAVDPATGDSVCRIFNNGLLDSVSLEVRDDGNPKLNLSNGPKQSSIELSLVDQMQPALKLATVGQQAILLKLLGKTRSVVKLEQSDGSGLIEAVIPDNFISHVEIQSGQKVGAIGLLESGAGSALTLKQDGGTNRSALSLLKTGDPTLQLNNKTMRSRLQMLHINDRNASIDLQNPNAGRIRSLH